MSLIGPNAKCPSSREMSAVGGRPDLGVDAVAKALSRFEASTRFKSFRAFHYEQAIAFKGQLAEQTNVRTGTPLSKATIVAFKVRKVRHHPAVPTLSA